MTRHRFEAYLDKVFGFSDLVSALPEGRQFPQHPWKKVFDAVFLGAAMQIPSLLQIEAECRHGALAKRIGPVSDDTLGYSLERQSPEPLFALSCEIARRLKRNGVLHSDWSRGLAVAAVDGIEICSSFARCCDACMEREVQHKVNGEMQTDIQYYHRIVVVVLVSTDFPIPLGVRFQKNGEAEVACALALLQDLLGQLGRRFLDVLVGDALYLQAPFVKEVERLGLVWAFTLKENQPELLREAERFTQQSSPGIQAQPGGEIRYWHLPEVDWPVADRQVRVVKTVRIEHQRRVTVSEKDAHRTKAKAAMSQQSTNFYATNFELGSISPLFIHQLSRSRWRIGVSSQGHINQSVKVRPRLKDSSLVAGEASRSESETMRPSDNMLRKEYAQLTRLQRTVNADVASLHATPEAETVDNVRKQQELTETSPIRWLSPAGYQRRHGEKEDVSTGEALGARRRKLAEEAPAITLSGKSRCRHQGGGSGRTTVDGRAAKRARRKRARTGEYSARQGEAEVR